jgi:hypothetical protein
MRPPQAPAVLTSFGGVRQVRFKRGRGMVRGCGVGRGQQGVFNQPQQMTVPSPQQVMKMVPMTKVTRRQLVAAALLTLVQG